MARDLRKDVSFITTAAMLQDISECRRDSRIDNCRGSRMKLNSGHDSAETDLMRFGRVR